MGKIFKSIIVSSISVIRIFYTYKVHQLFYTFKNKVYTLWIKKEFKQTGYNIKIQSPCILIGSQYISIGENFIALERARLECWDFYQGERYNPQLKFGKSVTLGYNVHIGCINEITIGDNVLFGSNIFITDHNHGQIDHNDKEITPLQRKLFSKGPVIIKDNVWIGDNVAILPNVSIGENCIIGTNSVVTKSFGPNSVIGGNPAKLIRQL